MLGSGLASRSQSREELPRIVRVNSAVNRYSQCIVNSQ
jgi:hypothetical protein